MPSPTITIRLEPELLTRIDAECKRTGENVSEFLRAAAVALMETRANERRGALGLPQHKPPLSAEPPVRISHGAQRALVNAGVKKRTAAAAAKLRATPCVHRMQPGQFCKRCDS